MYNNNYAVIWCMTLNDVSDNKIYGGFHNGL